MALSDAAAGRMRALLEQLYGDRADQVLERVAGLARMNEDLSSRGENELWDEHDIFLITYGDQIHGFEKNALDEQREFLIDHHLDDAFSTVHILPFAPYTSDDGFSVVDYRAVNPDVGDWDDVAALSKSFDLMFDLVLNHCSQASEYFQGYIRGEEPYTRFFIEGDPNDERLKLVTRPRSLPLLSPYLTPRGEKHIWTTFSADQVDLNFAEPDVLIEMLDVLLGYVRKGARVIRLDAIAYLWKELGTNCIHLPQTHAAVKIMRLLLDEAAPGTIVLTETNVPHKENVSYFGVEDDGKITGDEAQMVYQFSLAPLLLDAFVTGDATPLVSWLTNLEPCGEGMTYFNFTASHDGVGVRPLEGLVTTERRDALVDAVKARGGHVSTKRNSDGSDSPYELNITYFSAMRDPSDEDSVAAQNQVDRFLASQAVMLALRGIPGVYFHSLVGTPNDAEGVERTGRARSINRRKYERDELERLLMEEGNPQGPVFRAYREMMQLRTKQPAFHPDGEQQVLASPDSGVIAFVRTSLDEQQRIAVLCNATTEPKPVPTELAEATGTDLITGDNVDFKASLPPLRTMWVEIS
ncbi:alpha-amylase family glycosyl hydrolase [Calycomorphotria hydatis]|uniref:Sucrose phosphorylase n=1 Tax=Calycomorphotria hydatis TaxID=2528027 RepID=A0A517T3U1_9PLAN|nr:alpha-amylase family glycosyl hydrolase [Calycomorphotria hydatis]QDT63047.1 Sucrose phosphorylase [Calycomorphotria hydatis]